MRDPVVRPDMREIADSDQRVEPSVSGHTEDTLGTHIITSRNEHPTRVTTKWIASAAAIAVALGVVGYMLSSGAEQSSKPLPSPAAASAPRPCVDTELCVAVVTDPQEMRRLIGAMPQLDPQQRKDLLHAAENGRSLEVLTFQINRTAPVGDDYFVRTDKGVLGGHHEYTISTKPQVFSLPATRNSLSFHFEVESSRDGEVSGQWSTPGGTRAYRLVPGTGSNSMEIPLK